ncbi:MAG: aminotransferase class I/II-fold pyridoxal phosphate-dependent enzyme [Armatimonadota bacterium]
MHIASRVKAVPASGIRKFFDIAAEMDDVISLGVGEPDFVTPPQIRRACVLSLEEGRTAYTSNYGTIELRRALSEHIERKRGVSYNPANQILVTVGVSEAIDLAMRAILEPGDEVVLPEPSFVAYKPCIIFAGGVPVPVCATAATNFTPSPEQIEAAITPRTRAIFVGYPCNPTGAVMPKADMQKVVDLAVKHDLYIITDEVYDRLIYGVEHVCVPALDGAYERTIYLNGFSKAYAMTGWRLGYACGNREVIEAMMKIHQYIMMCASTPAQMAALEALKSGEQDVEAMRAEYDARRKVIVSSLNEMGLPCIEPKGAFYAFPSIAGTGLSSEEFVERLLMTEKVAVVPGNAFGECGEGYIRCCYASSIEKIKIAMERMARFVKNL